MARVPVMLTVNGREEAEFVEPGTLLVEVLRDKLELTGTRVGCNQGTCGACTVLVDGELDAVLPDAGGAGERQSRDDHRGRGAERRTPCRSSGRSPRVSPPSAGSAPPA